MPEVATPTITGRFSVSWAEAEEVRPVVDQHRQHLQIVEHRRWWPFRTQYEATGPEDAWLRLKADLARWHRDGF